MLGSLLRSPTRTRASQQSPGLLLSLCDCPFQIFFSMPKQKSTPADAFVLVEMMRAAVSKIWEIATFLNNKNWNDCNMTAIDFNWVICSSNTAYESPEFITLQDFIFHWFTIQIVTTYHHFITLPHFFGMYQFTII